MFQSNVAQFVLYLHTVMSSCKHDMQSETPTIAEWYQGRSILVTGATGFMGKVLLEKILRSIPDIGNIYILVRPKYGLKPISRIDEITKLPLFQQLRETNPQVLKKIIAIEGDVTLDNLGINESNTTLLHAEVSVVFHVAATVKLGAPLKDAVKQNLFGPEHMLKFCKGIKNLAVLMHLSTAYCHCDLPVLEEKLYPPTQDPKNIMNLVSWMDDKTLDLITPSIIEPHPNTYTFTKRLAETVVAEYGDELPIVIVRPSIVLPTIQGPIPGWVDTLNGPVGVLAAAGKGVMRTMMVAREKHAEVVPVDIACNAMIIAAWFRGTRSYSEIPVWNLSQSQVLPITWGEVLDKGRKAFIDNPFDWPLWYPDGDIRTNKLVHWMIIFLFQVIPAYFVDFLLMVFMQKKFLVRIQRRIIQGMDVLQYFALREWKISNTISLASIGEMCDNDKEIFYTENVPRDVDEYLKNCILGTRKYCLKEDPKSLPRARRYLTFLYYLDRLCKCLFFIGVLWMLLQISTSVQIFHDNYHAGTVKL